MRERGTQVRRVRLAEAGAAKPPPKAPNGGTFWPAVAITAIIIATAGWTVVAVMALNGPAAPAAAQASASDEDPDEFFDESEEPIPVTHDFPELEALLPGSADGVIFEKQSWAAGLYEANDGLTEEVVTMLAAAGKAESDVHAAGAGTIDFDAFVSVYVVDGVAPETLRDTLIVELVASYENFVTTAETIGDKTVTRGGEAGRAAFWWAYVADPYLFIVEGGDEDLANRLIGTLSAGPPPEVPPRATAAPTPVPSADASAS